MGGAADLTARGEIAPGRGATTSRRTCRAVVDQGWEVQERDGTVRAARGCATSPCCCPRAPGSARSSARCATAGVPYRVEGGSLVFRTQELRDLINCLTAIDDPSDEVAVVGALRSPAFACSDVELAEHRRRGPALQLPGARRSTSGRTASREALRCLRAHHHERHDRLARRGGGALRRRARAGGGRASSTPRSRDAFRRARFVVEQARAFEADRPQGLRAFVAWLEERTTGPIFDRDGAGLDDDEDAVRILTIHAAKGLEFPIVILAGIGPNPAYARPPTVSTGPAGDVVVVVGRKDARFGVGDVAGADRPRGAAPAGRGGPPALRGAPPAPATT